MTILIENNTNTDRKRLQTPTAYIKSEYGAKKIAEIFAVPLSSLKVFPGFNKRVDYDLDELKTFIKQNGIAFPALRLMYIEGELFIDEGHRRHAAMIELNLDPTTPVPVYIGESSSPEERLARQVTSNSGKNYTFIELVSVAKELMQRYHLDQSAVAKLIGKSQGAVSQMTKFFGYSQLLYTAINRNEIKYTRVLDLHKRGMSESDILDVVAKEKHAKENPSEVTDDTDTLDEEFEELNDSEQFMEMVNGVSGVTVTTEYAESDTDTDTDTDIDTHTSIVLGTVDKNKLSDMLGEKPKKAKVVKSAGQIIKASNVGVGTKKANPAKLLATFLACAEIIDNGDGTISYKVTKAESNALQQGANNM